MTLEDIDAGECFISMMSAIIEPMTFELAQQEANADYCIFRPKPIIDSDVIRSHFPI